MNNIEELKILYTKILIENLKLICIKDLKDTYDIIIKKIDLEDRFVRCINLIKLWYFLHITNDNFYKLSKFMQKIINDKIHSIYYGTEFHYESYFNKTLHIYDISDYLTNDFNGLGYDDVDYWNLFYKIFNEIFYHNLDEEGISVLIKNELFLINKDTIYI
jgi:hypothetical protein